MISETTQQNIRSMMDAKPIPNPCPEMETIGYKYEYCKGLVDETPYYTRVEEDSIVYTSDKYIIQFNLASKSVVLSMNNNNGAFYGNKPTAFLNNDLLKCIEDIRHKLGWD